MAIYQYVILSCATVDQEAEFDLWYDGVHLADVARVDGVVSARRYPILSRICDSADMPNWRSLAIYEIDAEDPQAVIANIAEKSGTDAMPLSDAISMDGLVQILAGVESGRG